MNSLLSIFEIRPGIWAPYVSALIFLASLVHAALCAQTDFSGKSLAVSNYRGRDLRGVNFAGADLSMADFSGADLRGADLKQAKIDRTNFDGADLRGVLGWSRVVLGLGLSANDANFSGTDLRGAKIVGGYSGGYFERANFTDADLTDAMLEGRFHGAKFDGATVQGTLMLGADGLEEINPDLKGRGAIVTTFDFAAACRSGRDFTGARLHGVDLASMDLTRAKLSEADLHSTNLDKAQLAGADLQGAVINFGSAEKANFAGANLERAQLVNRKAEGASFARANLRRASLSSADLRGVNFRDANLAGADLSFADLTGADLTGAVLDGIVVDAAIFTGVQGLEPDVEHELTRKAARWQHDLGNSFEWFLRNCSVPFHLVLTPLALLGTITGFLVSRARVSFAVLMTVNLAAVMPYCLAQLFGLMGGSPTAQMSEPGLWSAWFDLWTYMMSGLMALVVVSLGVAAYHIVRYVIMKPRERPLLSLVAALLTPANCFFALGTLVLFAPDA